MERYKYNNINAVMDFINSDTGHKVYSILLLEANVNYSNERIRNALYILTRDKFLIRIDRGLYIKNTFTKIKGIDKTIAILNHLYDGEFRVFDSPLKYLLDAGLTTQVAKERIYIHSLTEVKVSENEINNVIKNISYKKIVFSDLHIKDNAVTIISTYLRYSSNVDKAINLINDIYGEIFVITKELLADNLNYLLLNNLQDKTSYDVFNKLNKEYNEYFISINH